LSAGDVAGSESRISRGQLIQCTGKIYKVVDIDLKQMVIVDSQTGENYTIKSQSSLAYTGIPKITASAW